MKVTQKKGPYAPITIELKTRHEAKALFGLIDKLEGYRCNEGIEIFFTEHEIDLIVFLSNLCNDELVVF